MGKVRGKGMTLGTADIPTRKARAVQQGDHLEKGKGVYRQAVRRAGRAQGKRQDVGLTNCF